MLSQPKLSVLFLVFDPLFHLLFNHLCNPQINKLMVIPAVIIVIDASTELFIPLSHSFFPSRTGHIYEDFTARDHYRKYGAFDWPIQYTAIIPIVQELTAMVFVDYWLTVVVCMVCWDVIAWRTVAAALTGRAGFLVD